MYAQGMALVSSLLVIFISLYFLCFFTNKYTKTGQKLPPGPRGLPIIGNLLSLGNLPHQTLCNLSKKYGPVMSIKLGSVTTIVVSSPYAAEQFLKTHDHVFASRPIIQASEILSYGSRSVAFTQYGPYWRNARKLCVLQLLSTSKIESFKQMRTQEIESTVESVKKASLEHGQVIVSTMMAELFENMTYKMVLGRGKDFYQSSLKENVQEIAFLVGAFNIADFIPLFAPFDLQGYRRRLEALSKSLDKVLENIIEDHERNAGDENKQHKNFVDVLLSMLNQPMNPQDGTDLIEKPNIKAILLDMIVAALETSATVVEWTLSELLKTPRVMLRLQDELKDVIGLNRMPQESDLSKLTYLDCVIKESLRLHPVAPLLVPRESSEAVTVEGHYIPKKSRVLVNVWAIGRDPNIWSNNANEFFPERFLEDDVDVRGYDFRLTPFGAGRRKCPGIQLGLVNVRIVLAQLVHCFDWKLPDGVVAEELDMTEKFGLSVARANHLIAVPSYRLCC